MAIITNQAAYFEKRRRRCPNCDQPQRMKDVRTKCVQTVFGRYRFRGRRFQACKCFRFVRMPKTLFPLGELIPRRTTPELRYLLAELGARMPYREASRTFKMCSFGGMRASHSAIRRHTLALGYFLHWQQFHSFMPNGAKRPEAADSMVVGIDDTYIRHHKPRTSRQIQVTAGRLERNGELAGRFAFVAGSEDWRPYHFGGFLNQQGLASSTDVRIVNDGDKGLQNFVRKVLRSAAPSQLDWFHIGMRLERLKKAVRLPVTYAEYLSSPDASKPREKRVSLIRDALWRGRAHEAEAQFDLLQREVDSWRRQHPEGGQAAVEQVLRLIAEFRGYVCSNRRCVRDFAKARAEGRRISTAHVESVMNHLVNHRMSKRQQMRWSPEGAHYLLQVRTELLNGTLPARYRILYPGFHQAPEYVDLVARRTPPPLP